jgi:long-subunit acyl-CoA synthetase (AMP-forming)
VIKEYAPVRTRLYPAISLYDTLGKDAVCYILNHIEAKCVFVGDEKKLESILSILDELQFLELIVTFEGLEWEKLIFVES